MIMKLIFFLIKTFNLIGWQTKDIYQNINVTYLSSIQVNQQVEKIYLNYLHKTKFYSFSFKYFHTSSNIII